MSRGYSDSIRIIVSFVRMVERNCVGADCCEHERLTTIFTI